MPIQAGAPIRRQCAGVAPNVAAGIPQALVFAGFGQWCRKRPLAPYWLCWRMMGVSDDGAGAGRGKLK
jgi:hypothetical protein